MTCKRHVGFMGVHPDSGNGADLMAVFYLYIFVLPYSLVMFKILFRSLAYLLVFGCCWICL